MSNESKKIMPIYTLIILFGLIIFTSFFKFEFGNFDWPFFIIMICYGVFSSIVEIFVTNSIVSGQSKVISARASVHKSLQRIDERNKWDQYKKELVESQVVSNFYEAYLLYYYIDKNLIYKRANAKLSEKDFKSHYLDKTLVSYIKNEKFSLRKKHLIRKLTESQDDSSYVDKVYVRYKKNHFLGKSSSKILAELVSIIIQLVGLALSIYSCVRFDTSKLLTFKLVIIAIFFVADIYFVYKQCKISISYEIEMADIYSNISQILLGEKESDNKNRMAYYLFDSIK